eukprot:gene14535-biopygen7873
MLGGSFLRRMGCRSYGVWGVVPTAYVRRCGDGKAFSARRRARACHHGTAPAAPKARRRALDDTVGRAHARQSLVDGVSVARTRKSWVCASSSPPSPAPPAPREALRAAGRARGPSGRARRSARRPPVRLGPNCLSMHAAKRVR